MNSFDDILERIKKATGARTQVELANILGIRQSSISDAKRRNSVPADWYLKLYRTHGLNPDWLSDAIEPMYLKPGMVEVQPSAKPQGVREPGAPYGQTLSRCRVVSVASMVGAAGDDGWQPDHIGQLAIPEAFYRSSLLVVQMDGAGMEPIIRRKGFVGIDTELKRVISGEIYAVHLDQEGLVLKRVFYDPEAQRFILRSESADYPEQHVPFTDENRDKLIIGRVVWVLQEM